MKNKILLISLFLILHTSRVHAQLISTVAGDSTVGHSGDGGQAVLASLNHPIGVAVDAAGNFYIGDRNNNEIRKVTAAGTITTIAGTFGPGGYSGDNGPATAAVINFPYGVAVDDSGNVYFNDEANFRVRKISTSGIITTIAGTGTEGYNGDNIAATIAEIHYSSGVVIDGSGNIYITDSTRIRKITSGIITTIAGDGTGGFSGDNGPATAAQIYNPYCITVDKYENIYFTDVGNIRVRKIDSSGTITTIAGNGTGGYNGDNIAATDAELAFPYGIAVSNNGDVYIGDEHNNRVRKIDFSGMITTIGGTGLNGYNGDGILAIDAELDGPTGIALDNSGDIYIADFYNNRIRFIRNTVMVNTINKSTLDLAIYPNPNCGDFITTLITNEREPIIISITNIFGENLKVINTTANQQTDIRLNAPPGIYFLTATCAAGKWTRRIIIE